MLCTSLSVLPWNKQLHSVIGLTAVQWTAPRSLPGQIIGVRLLAACCCAVLVWLGGFLTPLVLVGVLVVTLVGLTNFEYSLAEQVAAE